MYVAQLICELFNYYCDSPRRLICLIGIHKLPISFSSFTIAAVALKLSCIYMQLHRSSKILGYTLGALYIRYFIERAGHILRLQLI